MQRLLDPPPRATAGAGQSTHPNLLTVQLEQRMAAARPRLLRLARAQGIAPDAAEDVAQDTLVEAWRHLAALSAPEGFEGWLAAICRNVSRRYLRLHGRLEGRQAYLPAAAAYEDGEGGARAQDTETLDLADPLAVDPASELDQQDLETLLDHALGYLPASARSAVELCYLDELPQREAALRLGLTISALEARLHRARRQLRQVLAGALRVEAQSFGLTVDDGEARSAHSAGGAGMATGWRQTRLWCISCGRCRLYGAFEPLAGGHVNLHVRCPACLREVSSHGVVPLSGLRSFRPAYRRHLRYVAAYVTQGLTHGWHPCPFCGARQPVHLVELHDLGARGGRRPRLRAALQCAACGADTDPGVAPALWSHPAAERFMREHPRCISEPETLVDFAGRPAIRLRLADVTSAAQLTMLADARTLEVRAVFPA
jgi:RNA polymerase sigma factor (sigma-70 family)